MTYPRGSQAYKVVCSLAGMDSTGHTDSLHMVAMCIHHRVTDTTGQWCRPTVCLPAPPGVTWEKVMNT